MKPLDAIDILARQARQEIPPQMHVRIGPLLCACQREQSRSFPLTWPAIISAVAACIFLLLAIHVGRETSDSVTPLFSPLQVTMP